MTPLLTIRDVTQALKVSRTTLSQMVKRGEFPQPIMLTANVKRWTQEDVAACMESKRASSAAQASQADRASAS